MIPGIESLACGPLAVPYEVMEHVVRVESSRNPYAIGVVGGRLERQPRSLGEAVATMRMLEKAGRNYSVGLAQVNRINFEAQGLSSAEQAFDPCANLAAGARILADCLRRHDGRWGDAFSCYYSGNATTGYRHGYVARVFASMAGASRTHPVGDPVVASRVEPVHAARARVLPEALPRTEAPLTPAASTSGAESPEAAFIAEMKALHSDGTPSDGLPLSPPPAPPPSQSPTSTGDAARVF
ncbi:MAG: lytic transglycosylase domain-containing protein [Lysobacteraceae bacterium]|jgi:type IV secretion system protein VirB1